MKKSEKNILVEEIWPKIGLKWKIVGWKSLKF